MSDWSASGPKTRSNGYVRVGGRVTTPRPVDGAAVSIVMSVPFLPVVDTIMGEFSCTSLSERRLQRITTRMFVSASSFPGCAREDRVGWAGVGSCRSSFGATDSARDGAFDLTGLLELPEVVDGWVDLDAVRVDGRERVVVLRVAMTGILELPL